MLYVRSCFVCQKSDLRELESNTGRYFYCPKCIADPDDIIVCRSCFEAGKTTCPSCGSKLVYHDGHEEREFQRRGGRF